MHSLQNYTSASVAGLQEQDGVVSDEYVHNCYESEEFIKFQYTVDDLLLAASTASTVFNFLVLYCAFKLFGRSGDTMHLFIVNMTLGDLLLTVFCHPNEVLTRKHKVLQHLHLCAIIHFGNWLGLAVSGLSLTLLNVDKLIYFQWPLKYDLAMSKRRCICLCVFIWGVSLGFVSYVWIFDIVYVSTDCTLQMNDQKKYYYEIFMIMFCVLPVTSSFICSAYLFRLTRRKRHTPAPAVDNGGTGGNHNMDINTLKNKMKSLMFIFATTAWTSFSLLPYRIFNICRIHLFEWNNIGCEQRVIMNWLAWILIYLLTLNPIVNPLITAIIYAPYRKTLKKLLINIPIGNRLYTYRGETETSYLSVRRTRPTASSSTDQELNNMGRTGGVQAIHNDDAQRQSLTSSADTNGSGPNEVAPGFSKDDKHRVLLLHNGFHPADSSDDYSLKSSIKSSSKSMTIKVFADDIDSTLSSTPQIRRQKNISFQSKDAAAATNESPKAAKNNL